LYGPENGRPILDNGKREKLKLHVRDKIEGLKEDIAAYKLRTLPVSPDNAIGRISRMEAINDKSIYDAALNKALQTLPKLERLLTMIDDPEFGLCRECEEPIPFGRLMIMPESDLCVHCAGFLEG